MGFDGSPGGVELYLYDQRILELCDEFVPGDPPEYFFDKNPENFSAILELHRLLRIVLYCVDKHLDDVFLLTKEDNLLIFLFRNGYLHISENGCALVLQVSRNRRR